MKSSLKKKVSTKVKQHKRRLEKQEKERLDKLKDQEDFAKLHADKSRPC